MKRRDFLTFAGAAAAWPLSVRAQQPSKPVVGFLHSAAPDLFVDMAAAFRKGLAESGYVDGHNVAIEYRWANNQLDQLPRYADELVRAQVTVIFASGGPRPALAAKGATATIPIVFSFGDDPVKLGLVASMNRPGGNITGVTYITSEVATKRLELLSQLLPNVSTIGYLVDPRAVRGEQQSSDMPAAARLLGRRLVVLNVAREQDIEPAFESAAQSQAGALVVGGYLIFTGNRDKLVTLAARYRIPTIYPERAFAAAGGIMSYGANSLENYRLGGVYVGQVLMGAKPADIPVQQPTTFELVLNLKAMKALNLTVPRMVLAAATEVIE